MSNDQPLPVPPIFGSASSSNDPSIRGVPGLISLDDIFDDFLFSTERLSGGQQTKEEDIKVQLDNDDFDESDDDGDDADSKRRKRARGLQRYMTEEQKVERRSKIFPFQVM